MTRFFLKSTLPIWIAGLTIAAVTSSQKALPVLFKANDPHIHYVGRIDDANPLAPRFWAAGVYVKAKFKGTSCIAMINDEVLYGNSHNYIEIAVDDRPPYRIKLTGKENAVNVADGLTDGEHTLTICKDTEAGIGYLELTGLKCDELLPLPAEPARKIEFIGNSITCGAGMDLAVTPCSTGQWYDQHNAYMAYGPQTARNLNAQWHLTSVSGIGLMHSCCDMKIVLPQVFNKVSLNKDTIAWDFKKYQPDVVTICLGQNDGVQDSTLFCSAYIQFIGTLRQCYPKANIVCLSSPMADDKLVHVLKNYIAGITRYENKVLADKRVSHYFFNKRYYHGCGTHPDMAEHKLIADELTAYIKRLKHW